LRITNNAFMHSVSSRFRCLASVTLWTLMVSSQSKRPQFSHLSTKILPKCHVLLCMQINQLLDIDIWYYPSHGVLCWELADNPPLKLSTERDSQISPSYNTSYVRLLNKFEGIDDVLGLGSIQLRALSLLSLVAAQQGILAITNPLMDLCRTLLICHELLLAHQHSQ
jgi:hypothetical protein